MVSRKSKSQSRIKKPIPPSRARYEKANPAVTVRIPRELREALAALKKEYNLSLGEVLRIGLEKAKPDLDAAFQQGWLEGYDIAEAEYKVTFYCSHCRSRHLSITDPKTKEAAAKLMCQAGWHSSACR